MKSSIVSINLAFILFCCISTINAQRHGLVIDSTNTPFSDGMRIAHATNDGIVVSSAGDDGLVVGTTQGDGIFVFSAGNIGVLVRDAVHDGIHVESAGDDGLHVSDPEGMGVIVFNAGADGIRVQSAEGYSMNIQGNRSGGAIDRHIGLIYNRNSNNSDVLALKVNASGNLSQNYDFITFFNGDDEPMGSIEGNGAGGVMYSTSGGDFAEVMPRLHSNDFIDSGDIIGISEGAISHNTNDAIQLMIITDRPAVLGNQGEEDSLIDEKVSFIGQVPVKVIGPVEQGDWIVPSGLNDGIGIAVSSEELELKHRIVGRAWETNHDLNLKKVNCVVGLDQSEAKDVILQNMQGQIIDLQLQIDELKSLILKVD